MTASTSGTGAKALHERAQGWSFERRMRKVQEECGELIAAINRYLERPGEATTLAVAEEIEGVRITLENVKPDWDEHCKGVRSVQLQRLRNALNREGL